MIQEPALQSTLWGGQRLAALFGKLLPEGQRTGESWELADHPHGTSRVANGPLKGRTLRQIARDHADELYGSRFPRRWLERFPLLLKFIDAAQDLSIQVHPDERYIAGHGLPDSAKTEFWVVLQTEPGARLITGVRPGTHPEAFRRAAEQGALDNLLLTHQAVPGDTLLLPAGRLHAIGAGVVLAEFQQPSDTTFRIYDWGRTDAHGRSRDLHLDEAMACINFAADFPPPVRTEQPNPSRGVSSRRLVACDSFYVDQVHLAGADVERRLDQGFECAMITQGQGEIVSLLDDHPLAVPAGRTVLVPAAAGSYRLRSTGSLTALLGGVPKP